MPKLQPRASSTPEEMERRAAAAIRLRQIRSDRKQLLKLGWKNFHDAKRRRAKTREQAWEMRTAILAELSRETATLRALRKAARYQPEPHPLKLMSHAMLKLIVQIRPLLSGGTKEERAGAAEMIRLSVEEALRGARALSDNDPNPLSVDAVQHHLRCGLTDFFRWARNDAVARKPTKEEGAVWTEKLHRLRDLGDSVCMGLSESTFAVPRADDPVEVAFEIIKARTKQGMGTPAMVLREELKERGHPKALSTITRHYIPQLKLRGVTNDRKHSGYRFRPDIARNNAKSARIA